LVAFFLVIAWFQGPVWWDTYISYSGVVVEKGMDCNLCLLGRGHTLDLYLVIQDPSGKSSKRYVGTDRGIDVIRWNSIPVGSFVVKDKGYGEFPYEPGKKTSFDPHATNSNDWIVVLVILVAGTSIFFKLRQLWKLV
jgi:hypothetical protein